MSMSNKSSIRRLSLISNSYIPSRYANSIQIMKMAEAYAANDVDVTLRVLFPIRSWLKNRNSDEFAEDIWTYYGVDQSFRIRRLLNMRVDLNALISPYLTRRGHADVVISRSIKAAVRLINLGVPTVYEGHDFLRDQSNSSFSMLIQQKASPSFLGLVAISHSLANAYWEAGFPTEKMLVAHDGVNVKRFQIDRSLEHIRRKLGIAEGKTVVFYSGHLYARRGIEEILASAVALPHLEFYFLGGHDKDVKWRQQQAVDASLTNVHFLGFVRNNQVPLYLAAADILLMPYSEEIATTCMSPLKMFEYMAAGKGIVASDLPHIREVLCDYDNAILATPDDANALISAIKRLAEDTELRQKLGAKALQDVAQYDWNARAHNILDFMDRQLSDQNKNMSKSENGDWGNK